jgi:hypothetical protein
LPPSAATAYFKLARRVGFGHSETEVLTKVLRVYLRQGVCEVMKAATIKGAPPMPKGLRHVQGVIGRKTIPSASSKIVWEMLG